MNQSIEIELEGEVLFLNGDGSMYWPDKSILFVADIHLGKTNHFRKEGIPIPYQVAQENIQLLKSSIDQWKPTSLFFLGDLFHSEYNDSWIQFEELMNHYNSTEFHLIIGNHDILDTERYEQAGMQWHEEGLEIGPFSLCHHPNEVDHSYVLCGHLHPGVRIQGRGKQGMRLRCFWQGRKMMIMPAFGPFKGMKIITPKKEDEVYLLTSSGIVDGRELG